MSTELDKILHDCDTLRRALARDVGNEATDLRDRIHAQKCAIVDAIHARGGAPDDGDTLRMWDSVTRLGYLAEQLGLLASVEKTLTDAVKAAGYDR